MITKSTSWHSCKKNCTFQYKMVIFFNVFGKIVILKEKTFSTKCYFMVQVNIFLTNVYFWFKINTVLVLLGLFWYLYYRWVLSIVFATNCAYCAKAYKIVFLLLLNINAYFFVFFVKTIFLWNYLVYILTYFISF